MTRTTTEGDDIVTIYEYRIGPGDSVPVTKVKITGLTGSGVVLVKHSIFANNDDTDYISEDGIYTFKSLTNSGSSTIYPGLRLYSGYDIDCNIVIEQIPDYKGALVSDGIDDYGLCENFPTLTKENGYTILAIRKWLNKKLDSCFISKLGNNALPLKTSFVSEFILSSGNNYQNWGNRLPIELSNNDFIYQTSKIYCGKSISSGNETIDDSKKLHLFSFYNKIYLSSIALYALKIFDRDLTDEEIEYEKKKMIQRYEEKTGNKYVEQ